MIASKEFLDFIFLKELEFNRLVLQYSLLNLTPLIEKYGLNIKKLYGNYINTNRYSKNDKSIYTLSSSPVSFEKKGPSM